MIPLGVLAARRPPVACKNLVVTDGIWFVNGNYVASSKITFENSSDHFQLAVPVVAGETYSISRVSKLATQDRFRMGFTMTDPSVAGTSVYGYQSKDGALPLNLNGITVPAGCAWFVVYLGYAPHGNTMGMVQATGVQVELGGTATAYTDCTI